LYLACILEAMKKAIYTSENHILRNWLTNKRHEANLSQRQLAALLNIHHSIVGKIETGERQINVVELIQYCQILNTDPVEIIKHLKSSMGYSS